MTVPHRERRRYVRVRPAADYAVLVEVIEAFGPVPVDVVDMGMRGFGLVTQGALQSKRVGERLQMRVSLPEAKPFEAVAMVRHHTSLVGICGVELLELDEEARSGMQRAVSELLARGSST